MIKFIVAIDSERGMGKNGGIPWAIPEDKEYYQSKIRTGEPVLMGYGTYSTHNKPLGTGTNYVLTSRKTLKKEGFIPVNDLDKFLEEQKHLWVIGGGKIFEQVLDKADVLYITQVEGSFESDVFFPYFIDKFALRKEGKIKRSNGHRFQFQTWTSKNTLELRKDILYNR